MKTKILFLLLLSTFLGHLTEQNAFAQQGSGNGGGGELLFHSLTATINPWLGKNLANGTLSTKLHLEESHLSAEQLVDAYRTAVKTTPDVKFIPASLLQDEANRGDAGAQYLINHPARICMNHTSPNYIRCNETLFNQSEGPLQFSINLHEYLGVAGIEPSGGSETSRYSQYPISKYLMAFAKPLSVRYELSSDEAVVYEKGEPVIDQFLFNGIRKRYTGSASSLMNSGETGNLGMELQADGSYLFEVSGNQAEFYFFSIPHAQEEFMYVPTDYSIGEAHWNNYYLRKSDSIACVLISQDLKEDLFPRFKCRFQVSLNGEVKAFTDRVTPAALYKFSDFFFHSLADQSSPAWSSADRIYHDDPIKGSSFNANFKGLAAETLFSKLKVVVKSGYSGPIHHENKSAMMISCGGNVDHKEKTCTIHFNLDGSIAPQKQE